MRRSALLVGAAVVGVFAATVWLAREELNAPATAADAAPAPLSASAPRVVAAAPSPLPASDAPPATPGGESAGVPPEMVLRWVADTNSGDAATRAAGIAGLARAPRADALPALRRVLLNGEPGVDRPLALRALRDLALAQGDADGQVRDAVRAVIYHGDDAAPAEAAQEALDAIEASQLASVSQR